MNTKDWLAPDREHPLSPYEVLTHEALEEHHRDDDAGYNLTRETVYLNDDLIRLEEPESFGEANEEDFDDESEYQFEEAEDESEDPESEFIESESEDHQDFQELHLAEDEPEYGEVENESQAEPFSLTPEAEDEGSWYEEVAEAELEEDLIEGPDEEIESEYFEAQLTDKTETADFRILYTESDPPGKTIYINCDLKIPATSKITGIFVPRSFKPADQFEVIIYFHGYKYDTSKGPKVCYKGICQDSTVDNYWKNAMFPLRESLNNAGRNSILVLPTLGYKSNPGNLIYERGLDLFLNQVLRALAAEKAIAPEHTMGKIILAAHSGGGSPMLGIATHKDKFSRLVKECWAFDALYGGEEGWVRWINANRERKFYSYYLGTKPTAISEGIKRRCKRLDPKSFKRSDIRHHWDLVKAYWDERIAAAKEDTELAAGETPDEFFEGYIDNDEEYETEIFDYEAAEVVENELPPLNSASRFHSSRLSSGGSADLDAFKRRVYEAHVRWASSSKDKSGNKRIFVGDQPDDDLRTWERTEDLTFSVKGGKRIYKAVKVHKRMVEPLKQLLDAARKKAESENKNIRIYISSGYRSASQQFNAWDGNFSKYYSRAVKEGELKKGDYSEKAVEALNQFIRGKLGAPGYSNHQHGRAVDFFLLEENNGSMVAYKVDTTKENVKRYRTTWFLDWLNNNAHLFGFKPYVAEPWHWEYWGDVQSNIPPASAAPPAQNGRPVASGAGTKPSEVPKSVYTVLGWMNAPIFVANIIAKNTSTALKIAYQNRDIKDESTLTNLIFFTRHQNIPWRSLRREETELVREWLKIRDTEVRPWLRAQKGTTNAPIQPVSQPVAVTGTAVKILPASYDGMKGVNVSATVRPGKTNIKSPEDMIIACVSAVEGGFDTVNMYDKGIISWGIMQWTVHAGSLQKMLQFTKQRLAALGQPGLWDLFGGLELTASGDLQYKGTVYPVTSTNLPLIQLFRGSQDVSLVQFDRTVTDHWARTFALAGRDRTIQQIQMEYTGKEIPRSMSSILSNDLLRLKANKKFSKWISLTAQTAAPYQRKIEDYVGGSLKAKMLYFGMWTNNPSWAKVKLFHAIESFQTLQGGKNNPSTWTAGWESAFADEFEKVLRASSVGYWGDKKSEAAKRKSRTTKLIDTFNSLA